MRAQGQDTTSEKMAPAKMTQGLSPVIDEYAAHGFQVDFSFILRSH
jgi:hypothetical protein